MKLDGNTKQLLASVIIDTNQPKSDLAHQLRRLSEHNGTKMICRRLEKVIEELDRWQKSTAGLRSLQTSRR